MNGILDTLINIEIFVFVGILVWLYLKDFDNSRDSDD